MHETKRQITDAQILTAELRDCALHLLDDTTGLGIQRTIVEEMAELFAALHSFNLHQFDEVNSRKSMKLDTGNAVSTWSAAMCLLEMSRTREFLKGTILAITQMLEKTTVRPIHVLDAGCGPYALLSVVPALFFSAEEVQFHVLDILPESLQFVRTMVDSLQMQAHFGGMYQEDASKFQWPADKPLHIVVSETMLNALRKEPQVAITRNLAPQLTEGGCFIPQAIQINLNAVDSRLRQRVYLGETSAAESTYTVPIAEIMHFTQDTATKYGAETPLQVVVLPQQYDPAVHSLELHTQIQVYGAAHLRNGDCSLTLPFHLSHPYKRPISRGSILHFSYVISDQPGIQLSIAN